MKRLLKILLRRRSLDDEFRAELESHIEMRAELNRDAGMSSVVRHS